jgi:hypothetical protein
MVLRCGRTCKVLVLLLSIALILVAAAVVSSVRATLRRAETASRFQYIEVALMLYHKRNGCYPPQYLTDREGKPAHSWRVLLLPDLGYEDLYRRYRFDEPWNGPHNSQLAADMPIEYRSPFLDSKSTITQYVGIAGKETLWRGTTSLRNHDVQRGALNPLIWFVEAANSDIHWMEPRDIPLEQALAGIIVAGGRGIQSNYSDGLPAQMIPTSRELVPFDISPEDFRAMLTITPGKESDDEKELGKSPSPNAKTLSPDRRSDAKNE